MMGAAVTGFAADAADVDVATGSTVFVAFDDDAAPFIGVDCTAGA
jgi:hypothetical protein